MKTIVLEIIFHVTFIFNLTKCISNKKKTQIEMYVIRESKKSSQLRVKKKKEIPAVYEKKTKQKHPGFFPRKKERSVVSENVGQASYKG